MKNARPFDSFVIPNSKKIDSFQILDYEKSIISLHAYPNIAPTNKDAEGFKMSKKLKPLTRPSTNEVKNLSRIEQLFESPEESDPLMIP